MCQSCCKFVNVPTKGVSLPQPIPTPLVEFPCQPIPPPCSQVPPSINQISSQATHQPDTTATCPFPDPNLTYENDDIIKVVTSMGTFYWPESSTPEKTQHILNHFNLPHTPLNPDWWQYHLRHHPDQLLVTQVLRGIREGFPIGYVGPRTTSRLPPRTHTPDSLHQLELEFEKERTLGRVIGPYRTLPQPLFYFHRENPSFLVPKTDQTWRRIDNMSFPRGDSVNDNILPQDFPVDYTTTSHLMQKLASTAPNTPMSCRDISDAYRQVLVHPSDWGLMTLVVGDHLYVNLRLGMGTRSSCGIFDTLSHLTVWAILHTNWLSPQLSSMSTYDHPPTLIPQPSFPTSQDDPVTHCPLSIFNILDDSAFFHDGGINPATKRMRTPEHAVADMIIVDSVYHQLGWQLKVSKSRTGVTDLVYLGIGWNTATNSCYVPEEKTSKYRTRVQQIMQQQQRTNLKILRSIIGQLTYTCSFVPQSRTRLFYLFKVLKAGERRLKRREIVAGTTVSPTNISLTLSRDAVADLDWWKTVLRDPPMCRPILKPEIFDDDWIFVTDAAPSAGVGGYFRNEYFSYEFNPGGNLKHSTWAELAGLIISCCLWGSTWTGHTVLWRTDCLAHTTGIHKLRSSAPELLGLHDCLEFLKFRFHFDIVAVHIPGNENMLADNLSRGVFKTVPTDWIMLDQPIDLPSIISENLYRISWTTSK